MTFTRFAIVAASTALMLPFGSTLATTNSYSPFSLTDDRTLDLRATGSQLVVDTVEDALRQGGLALFDEVFQLDSSLNWVFGENIEGEIDAVVPLWSGGGHAVFVQPGFVFWTGLADEERIDGNLGIAYRTGLTKDVIGGASIFYDRDFKKGHSRISFGADVQSEFLHGAANYYQPLSDEEDGREGFVEEALRGMDFRLVVQRDIMRVSGNLGYWRFEGDDTVEADWKISYGLDAGIRIFPGVFLEGGWERHDEDVSLDSRWNAGLAFRFSLPDFKGASYGDGSMSSNLYQIVEREKRILYEERLGLPVASLSLEEGSANVAEGETRILTVELSEEIDEAITLNLVLGGTATFTDDYTVAEDGTAIVCEDNDGDLVCPLSFAVGTTEVSVEVSVVDDGSTVAEGNETVSLSLVVPDEHSGLLRGSGSVLLTIGGSGNIISIASSSDTTLGENADTATVVVDATQPAFSPITLSITGTGTATNGVDYRLPSTLMIPAGASSGSITLTGIDDPNREGPEMITITIAVVGVLPAGWDLGTSTHEITVLDDDGPSVFFVAAESEVNEPESGNTRHNVQVRLSESPASDVSLVFTTRGDATEFSDYIETSNTLTFSAGASGNDLTMNYAINILADSDAEGDETIELIMEDFGIATPTLTSGGNNFSFGLSTHIITIKDDD